MTSIESKGLMVANSFLFGLAMRHAGSSSTRDRTHLPCVGSAKS